MDVLSIVLGLAVLVVGGELVVRGASRLAVSLGLSPIVVGLTVVAFGTSSPELAVTLGGVLSGEPDVAVGNVVGSNIYNILLILGLAALMRRVVVRQQLVRFDVPLVIATSVLLWLLSLDGQLSSSEGAVLVALLVGYVAVSVWSGRRSAATEATIDAAEALEVTTASTPGSSRLRDTGVFAAGLAALVVGAQVLVAGATSLAGSLGVPDVVVGLTIVAIGTSLPELVTSVLASARGHGDLAIGNVMGSNLFNILGVLGLGALVASDGVPVVEQLRTFDIPVMTFVALACLPLLFTGYELRRWEGALFTAYAVIYTAYVVLDATGHPFVEQLGHALFWFVLPLTAITLATVVVREVVSRRRHPSRAPTAVQ